MRGCQLQPYTIKIKIMLWHFFSLKSKTCYFLLTRQKLEMNTLEPQSLNHLKGKLLFTSEFQLLKSMNSTWTVVVLKVFHWFCLIGRKVLHEINSDVTGNQKIYPCYVRYSLISKRKLFVCFSSQVLWHSYCNTWFLFIVPIYHDGSQFVLHLSSAS